MRDVVVNCGKYFKEVLKGDVIRRSFWAFVLVFLVSCHGKDGVEAFCEEIPSARTDLDFFRQSVASHLPRKGKASRKLASVSPPFSEELRSQWLEKTEKALKRTQWARDTLESERKGRKVLPFLNDASLSLVSIHGYLVQGKWKKAVHELEKVDRSLKRSYEIACSTPKKR